MLEQQDFAFVTEQPAPRSRARALPSRLREYAGLIALFVKLYFQARLLMVQNYILSCRLQLCELPLVYLKMEIFVVRLSLGFPPGECWPAEKSPSI